jgi:hypothetical protein
VEVVDAPAVPILEAKLKCGDKRVESPVGADIGQWEKEAHGFGGELAVEIDRRLEVALLLTALFRLTPDRVIAARAYLGR